MSALTDSTNIISQEIETVATKPQIAETVVAEPVITKETETVVADTDSSKPESTEEAQNVEDVKMTTEEAATTEGAEATPDEAVPEESTEKELSPEEKKESLSTNIVSGRRFMKLAAFDKATESLSTAAALSAEIFGEGHEDTFEAVFLYGQALLELAKVEDQVFSNAMTDIPKTIDEEEEEGVQDDVVEDPENVPEEERAEIKHKVEEALGVASDETETVEDQKNDETMEEVKEEEKTEEQTAEQAGEKAEEQVTEQGEEKTEDVEMTEAEGEEGEKEGSEGEAEDDDDESMKLAWELLETSRCICEKKLKALEALETADAEALKTWKLRHAEVLTSLGEHGVADSKYEQAQKDLAEALLIQAAHLQPTSRLLANTNHLLAKAFSSDSLFEKAASHFSDAKNILIAKTEELKKDLEAASDEAKVDIETEIKELEELIPEIDAFVVDALASEEQTKKIKEAAKKELESVAEAISKIADGEANDITDMVRRPAKRRASEEQSDASKKARAEDDVTTTVEEKVEATEKTESAQ